MYYTDICVWGKGISLIKYSFGVVTTSNFCILAFSTYSAQYSCFEKSAFVRAHISLTFIHMNAGNSLIYTISSLRPFTSYAITFMNGENQCTTTAATSEGGKMKCNAIFTY